MTLAIITRLDKNVRRLKEILSILGRYGVADWFGNLPYEWIQKHLVAFDGQRLGGLPKEARVRLALIELGTTFIKLGQILSTREDIVGPTLAAELKQLQDSTPPDPPAVVRQTVAAELGKPPEEVFQVFEAAAFASASIAQVHRSHAGWSARHRQGAARRHRGEGQLRPGFGDGAGGGAPETCAPAQELPAPGHGQGASPHPAVRTRFFLGAPQSRDVRHPLRRVEDRAFPDGLLGILLAAGPDHGTAERDPGDALGCTLPGWI